MTDLLLAQSAIDRLTSTCHELIVEGDSYRRRQRPPHPRLTTPPQRHHDAHVTRPGGPRSWRTAGPILLAGDSQPRPVADRDHPDEHASATRAYVQRRTAEGLSKKEIIRCLKRYVAREVYPTCAADVSSRAAWP